MSLPSRKLVDWLCLAALIALASAWASRPLSHDDLFGHLRAGEWMAAHRTVPLTDPFSFTRPGARWVTHEWAFSLLAWAVWLATGYLGLIVTRVLLVLAIGTAVAWRMQAPPLPRSIPWTTALLGLGLWALAAELILRAALVSELFLALTLVFLARFRQTGQRRFPVAIVILFFCWGNLHSGVIFGLFVLGLFALEGAFRERRPKPYLLTLGAAALVSLINPNGIEVWLYPFRLSRILFASGIAWDLGHFAAADPRTNTAFLILAVLLLAGLLPLRKLRELSIAEGVAIATFLALSFRSPRFLFHFAILTLPVLYRLHVGRPLRDWTPAMRRIAAAATVAVLALTAATAWLSHPRRLITPQLPEGAVRFLEANGIQGRLFNHQNFGGFLLWRTHQPIFWDGRNDVFVSLVEEYTTTPFPAIVERYGIDEILITEHELPGIEPEIPDRWGLVYWEDDSALYLRRDGRFGPLLDRLELHLFPGFGGRPGLESLARNPQLAAAARAELGRLLAINPENQRALYFGGVISLYQGDLPRAGDELRAALSIRPNEQVEKALAALATVEEAAAPK